MEEFFSSTSHISMDVFLSKIIDLATSLGSRILTAIVVFLIGRWIVKKLNRIVLSIMEKKQVEASLFFFYQKPGQHYAEFHPYYCYHWCTGYRNQFFYSLICICRCRYRYGLERNLTEFCRRNYDSHF